MFTGTFRRDGYSGFGSNNPWGNFGSVGLSWVFSEENFMSDAHDWMDMGKLRLSWGTNGNREFGDVYSTLSNLSLAGGSMVYYQNGNSNVVNPLYMSRLAAPNLEWEKTKAWNIGLDFSFLNGRLTANMDYYLKKTTDMIMSQRLPSFSGFGSIMANLGEVQNQGFEIALNSTNIQNRNFTWNTSVGFSINKNKINHIYYDYDENGVEKDDTSNGWFIGQAIGTIWYYETDGVWQNTPEDIASAALVGQKPGDPKVLDFYLEMIRNLHIRTYDYLGQMRASTNPLAYCEGGFYGGHLKPNEKIGKILKPMTASFGITALNELQELYNGKSIAEDGQFALDVLKYINRKVNEFKEKDGYLYAIYGTPAESLCGLQVEQFRKMYGIVKGVSDRPYVSNSFHCHVTEDVTPIEKQDLEGRFWELCNGGKIQYVRYPIDYNREAIRTLIRRAMSLGYYEGVNLSLAYCDDCGHEELEMDVCPVCGSKNLTKIDRMNGYLSYSRVHGDTRLNEAKMAEIAERKSM